jgi:hypothetical protein
MRWLRVSYVISRAGRPILLSATLLGGCGSSAYRSMDAPSTLDTRDLVIPLAPEVLDTRAPGPDGPLVPNPAIDGGNPSYGECIDIDAGADAGLGLPNGQAARVTLDYAGSGEYLGRIAVAPQIADRLVGLPSVDVIDKHPDAPDAVISNMRADTRGFAFDVAWTGRAPDMLCFTGGDARWTFRTTLNVQCGDQVRAVEALTVVAMCGNFQFASSGDLCEECVSVCEMAPSPLPPAGADDELPLASALDLVIRPLVRVGGAMVLVAQHAPRAGLGYTWHATGGTLEQLDQDVVLWRSPTADKGAPPLCQVAVTAADLAAVASYRWDRRAL